MHDSPFKFLNAYEKEDRAIFFGREAETEALYQMTFDTRLILLYGASGTGKTSLVQCGLANRFNETRWKEIYVRRNDDLNRSLAAALRRELAAAGGQTPAEPLDPLDAIRQVHLLTFKPIYLIFDQFEELFILGRDTGEQITFFTFIRDLLASNLSCKALLVMREEFLANLWEFEQTVPALFDYRYRVEKMRASTTEKVIAGMLRELKEAGRLDVEEPEKVIQGIQSRLSVDKAGVELTYLQVYLDQLYQLALRWKPGETPRFSVPLVEKLGPVEDVIGDFLDDQLRRLEQQLGPGREGVPIQILGALVTDEQTKKVLNIDALEDIRARRGITAEELETCLKAFENMRILKRYNE